ncbi:vasopressin V1b receptor [Sphaerodactylus townsendi]|uniref:Vasopressin V1b receptor n=1 Tax=Sphaerodactylus townsendi TaxID=933632 RepID=A0ACB8F5C1_9SAUR|nr:vasopressin V1b receptor [Sphaerodactylus townsendi]
MERNRTYHNNLMVGSLLENIKDADPNQTALYTRDEDLAKAEIGVLAAILVVTLVGNLGVLLAIYRLRKKMTRMNLFILHLGLTDLGVALFQVLPQMIWDMTYRFQGPDPLCRAVKYLQVLSMFASTYMLIAMTLDRYMAVCHPLRTLQQSSCQAYLMIGTTWLLSCLLSLPQIFIFSVREVRQGSGVLDCWADFKYAWGAKAYVTWITLCVFVLPVAILTICYSLICHKICKNLRGKTQTCRLCAAATSQAAMSQKGAGCHPGSRVSSVRTISRAKIRTVKMTFVIVLAYVACWAPFFSVQMWSVWDKNAPNDESSDVSFTITMLLGSLSSCCNPWIYMFFSGHLLHDILHYFSCCGSLQSNLKRQFSNGSLCSRKTTILIHTPQSTLSATGIQMQLGSLKDFYQPYDNTVTESGVL